MTGENGFLRYPLVDSSFVEAPPIVDLPKPSTCEACPKPRFLRPASCGWVGESMWKGMVIKKGRVAGPLAFLMPVHLLSPCPSALLDPPPLLLPGQWRRVKGTHVENV